MRLTALSICNRNCLFQKGMSKMGYIMELRRVVGHRPLIMTCAGVLIVNDKNQLLLEKRADNGLWGYPGGSMEPGDTFAECAAREVLEETGLVCDELIHYMNLSGEEVHYTYPNGDEIYAAEEVFLCRNYHGTIHMQKSEVSELRFFDLYQLPGKDEINPNNYKAINCFRAENEQGELCK